MTDTITPPKRTGRPPLTDHATLLATGRGMGFEGLSVAKITAEVGIKYSTFYRYWPGGIEVYRAELVEQVLGEATWPQGGPWRAHISSLAAVLRQLVRDNPGLAEVLATSRVKGRLADAARDAEAVLDEAGLGWCAADVVEDVYALALAGRPISLAVDGIEHRQGCAA